MPVVKLTVKAVEKPVAPDPTGKQVAHWDAELKGFAEAIAAALTGVEHGYARRHASLAQDCATARLLQTSARDRRRRRQAALA